MKLIAILSFFFLFSGDSTVVTQSTIDKHEVWVTTILPMKTAKISLIGPDGADLGSTIQNQRNGLITAVIALKDPIKPGRYTALVENKRMGVKEQKMIIIKP